MWFILKDIVVLIFAGVRCALYVWRMNVGWLLCCGLCSFSGSTRLSVSIYKTTTGGMSKAKCLQRFHIYERIIRLETTNAADQHPIPPVQCQHSVGVQCELPKTELRLPGHPTQVFACAGVQAMAQVRSGAEQQQRNIHHSVTRSAQVSAFRICGTSRLETRIWTGPTPFIFHSFLLNYHWMT